MSDDKKYFIAHRFTVTDNCKQCEWYSEIDDRDDIGIGLDNEYCGFFDIELIRSTPCKECLKRRKPIK